MRHSTHRGGGALLIVLLLLSWLPFPLAATNPNIAEAASDGCNLAPNTGFERNNSNGSLANWGLWNYSGQSSLSVVDNTYVNGQPPSQPGEVQSGARAAKINVTLAGEIDLQTDPEPTAILVNDGTTYTFSARMYNPGGRAKIRAIEWNNGAAIQDRQSQEFVGSSSGWVTLSMSFTSLDPAGTNTHYVSLRLFPTSTGTFYWDDVLFAKQLSGSRCTDMRHYVMQTTYGFKLCADNADPGVIYCIDGNKDQYKEFVRIMTQKVGNNPKHDHIRDHYTHTGNSWSQIAIHKNFDEYLGAPYTYHWRCFTDPGRPCGPYNNTNPVSPAQVIDLMRQLPIRSSSNIPYFPETEANLGGPTANIYEIHPWQKHELRSLNPQDASQTGVKETRSHRDFAFVVDSINFGGNIGAQSNVLVIEAVSLLITGGITPSATWGGERLERYYFVQGYGLVKAVGMVDSDCQANPSAQTCNSQYIVESIAEFNRKETGDEIRGPVAPYTLVDWW